MVGFGTSPSNRPFKFEEDDWFLLVAENKLARAALEVSNKNCCGGHGLADIKPLADSRTGFGWLAVKKNAHRKRQIDGNPINVLTFGTAASRHIKLKQGHALQARILVSQNATLLFQDESSAGTNYMITIEESPAVYNFSHTSDMERQRLLKETGSTWICVAGARFRCEFKPLADEKPWFQTFENEKWEMLRQKCAQSKRYLRGDNKVWTGPDTPKMIFDSWRSFLGEIRHKDIGDLENAKPAPRPGENDPYVRVLNHSIASGAASVVSSVYFIHSGLVCARKKIALTDKQGRQEVSIFDKLKGIQVIRTQANMGENTVLKEFHNMRQQANMSENIIKFIDSEEAPDKTHLYIYLELAALSVGQLLINIKSDHEALFVDRSEEAMDFARQMLAGLDFIHTTLKVIHRDVKPDNILVHYPPRYVQTCYVLSDFGLTKAAREISVTQVGTSIYKAPEVLKAEKHSVKRHDIQDLAKMDVWSAAVTLLQTVVPRSRFAGSQGLRSIELQDWSEFLTEQSTRTGLARGLLRNPRSRATAVSLLQDLIAERWTSESKRVDLLAFNEFRNRTLAQKATSVLFNACGSLLSSTASAFKSYVLASENDATGLLTPPATRTHPSTDLAKASSDSMATESAAASALLQVDMLQESDSNSWKRKAPPDLEDGFSKKLKLDEVDSERKETSVSESPTSSSTLDPEQTLLQRQSPRVRAAPPPPPPPPHIKEAIGHRTKHPPPRQRRR